ncbi:hypothetical protein GC207_01850 [bacterium]|nr:hypothetical protein [bacterium]
MKCRWYQFLISRSLDDDRPLSPRLEQHLANCEPCREFWVRQRDVIRGLHETKSTASEIEPSPFLRTRILQQTKSEESAPAIGGNVRWMWGGIAATAVVALVALMPFLETSRSNVGIAPSQNDTVSVALLEKTSRFTSGGNLLQAATNIDQPLHQELNLVISDAQNAIRSLREELLPSHLLAKGD